MTNGTLIKVQIRLPKEIILKIRKMVNKQKSIYPSRSEFIRTAVKQFLEEKEMS